MAKQKEKTDSENTLLKKTNQEYTELESRYKLIKKKLKREKELTNDN